MSTVGVAQALRRVIIFGEEQSCVRVVGGILIKQLIHRSQQPLRVVPGNGTLAAEVRLQVGHQESARDALPCNVAQHQSNPLSSEVEEVVIIASDLASLAAESRIFQRPQSRETLWEESCLHL